MVGDVGARRTRARRISEVSSKRAARYATVRSMRVESESLGDSCGMSAH